MPSLVRFVLVVGLLGALVYACMVALVTYVEVSPRTMEQVIPPARLNK